MKLSCVTPLRCALLFSHFPALYRSPSVPPALPTPPPSTPPIVQVKESDEEEEKKGARKRKRNSWRIDNGFPFPSSPWRWLAVRLFVCVVVRAYFPADARVRDRHAHEGGRRRRFVKKKRGICFFIPTTERGFIFIDFLIRLTVAFLVSFPFWKKMDGVAASPQQRTTCTL